MYTNIIDQRRRNTQYKIWKFLDYIIKNNFKNDLWVRQIIKNFKITNRSLESYFWQNFKIVKWKKIYNISSKHLKSFLDINEYLNIKKIDTLEKKEKKLLLTYLVYNLRK